MRHSQRLLALALGGALGMAGVAWAQQPAVNTTSPSTNSVTGVQSRSAALPARTDNADDAWAKLGYKGFVTKEDVKGLQGFSFDAADMNHDGQLSQDEFRAAWSTYRTPTPSSGAKATTNGSPTTSSPGMAPGGSPGNNAPTTQGSPTPK